MLDCVLSARFFAVGRDHGCPRCQCKGLQVFIMLQICVGQFSKDRCDIFAHVFSQRQLLRVVPACDHQRGTPDQGDGCQGVQEIVAHAREVLVWFSL